MESGEIADQVKISLRNLAPGRMRPAISPALKTSELIFRRLQGVHPQMMDDPVGGSLARTCISGWRHIVFSLQQTLELPYIYMCGFGSFWARTRRLKLSTPPP